MRATLTLLEAGESFADLSVERITGEAGLARSTFYVQFADRRALLLALAERAAEPLLEHIALLERLAPEPDAERLRAGIAAVVGLARAHAPLVRAVVEAAAYDDAVRAYWYTLNDRVAETLAQRFADIGVEEGQSRVKPTALAAVLVGMVTEACLRQIHRPGTVEDDELTDALTAVWWRAIYAWRATGG